MPCCCLTELNAKPAPLNFKSYHTVSTTQSVPHCCAVWIQAARREDEEGDAGRAAKRAKREERKRQRERDGEYFVPDQRGRGKWTDAECKLFEEGVRQPDTIVPVWHPV